jgi:two-component system, chemotaxis family, chemotaxis protein CheY
LDAASRGPADTHGSNFSPILSARSDSVKDLCVTLLAPSGLHVSTHAARRVARELLLMQPILVVDDSPTIRRMVKAALAELAGAGFVEAASGLEAIERLMLTPVALMVLDLNMADMHGVEVLKFVRRHPGYQRLPVIVLTTRGDEESRKISLGAGRSRAQPHRGR